MNTIILKVQNNLHTSPVREIEPNDQLKNTSRTAVRRRKF